MIEEVQKNTENLENPIFSVLSPRSRQRKDYREKYGADFSVSPKLRRQIEGCENSKELFSEECEKKEVPDPNHRKQWSI